MRKTSLATAATLAVLLFGASACASSSKKGPTASSATSGSGAGAGAASSSGTPGSTGAKLNIGFVVRQTNNPVFDAMANGGRQAASQLGGSLTVVGPSTDAATSQIPYIQSLVVKKVAGMFVTANDPTALNNSLNAARKAGITVVGMDSPSSVDSRSVFVSDGTTQAIGIVSLKLMCEQLPGCKGQVAIISGAANSPNQNAWVAVMTKALKTDPTYSHLDLVKIAYGNDDPQTATTKAQGLLQQYPHLSGFLLPSSVAMVSTAQVLEQTGKSGKVAMTGLALPSQMKGYVKDGTVKHFAIWNMANLGYLSYWLTYNIHTGKIKGTPGETFTAGTLGKRTIGPQGIVSVGAPLEIDASNISQFNF